MLPWRRCRAACVSFVALLALLGLSPPTHAQEVRYYYDALNRLIGVVDPQGQAAEYVYDGVGNLLQIRRYTVDPGATVSLAMVTPAKGPEGATVELFGQGFSSTPADNTVRFNGVLTTVTEATPTRLRATVPVGATTGPVTVATLLGSATSPDPFTVLTGVTVSPSHVSVMLRRPQQFTAPAPVRWTVNRIQGGTATLGTIAPDGLYTPPPTLPTPSTVTITAIHQEDAALTGTATVNLEAPGAALASPVSVAKTPAPAAVTPLASGAVSVAKSLGPVSAAPLTASLVSVRRDPSPITASPQVAALVSLSREPVVTGVTPTTAAQGTSLTVTLSGVGFTGATSVSFERNGTADSALTVTDLVVAEGGAQATCTVTIAPGAAAGGRVARVTHAGVTSSAAGTGSNVLTVTGP